MRVLRPATDRGQVDIGWLRSRHTFSFGHYHDPEWMGFGPLRVINEDRVAAGGGFDPHSHRDMEILSYVLEGALEHRDSIGNGSVIEPGDVQRMTAGTGVTHSEMNASDTDGVHFLQIWIIPERAGLEPGYEQRFYGDDHKRGRLRLVASGDGRDESVRIHRDVDLLASVLSEGDTVGHTLTPGRIAWVQVARGEVEVDGTLLREGDGLATDEAGALALRAAADTEFLLFDMAV